MSAPMYGVVLVVARWVGPVVYAVLVAVSGHAAWHALRRGGGE